jgi:hypothetical protein
MSEQPDLPDSTEVDEVQPDPGDDDTASHVDDDGTDVLPDAPEQDHS